MKKEGVASHSDEEVKQANLRKIFRNIRIVLKVKLILIPTQV